MRLGRVLDMDRDYAVGAVYGLVLLVLVVVTPVLPTALAFTGPLVCPDGQPDTFVTVPFSGGAGPVSEPGAPRQGPSLFCMGDRGDVTEIGVLRPVLVLVAGIGLVVLALALALRGLRRAWNRVFDRA